MLEASWAEGPGGPAAAEAAPAPHLAGASLPPLVATSRGRGRGRAHDRRIGRAVEVFQAGGVRLSMSGRVSKQDP